MIASRLLSWYRAHRRPLPWRESADPYKIWVSEIMLQQTQVKTVIPYYERWLREFPDVRTLAKARRGRVLKLWEGLGYYSRARNLHEGAKLVARQFGGRLPSDRGEIRKIPGIGRYTAGAILSIAFGRPEPVLDGNVARVFSRLARLSTPADTPAGQKILWALAEKFLREVAARQNPGDFNQGLMELGATVCLPAEPQCRRCPLQTACLAKKHGDAEAYPKKANVTKTKKVRAVCGIVRSNGKVLLARRPAGGLWAGLWEFPTFRVAGKKPAGDWLEQSLRRAGVEARIVARRDRIRRTYTQHVEALDIFQCECPEGANASVPAPLRWVPVKALGNYAFPAAFAKIIRERL